MYILPVVISFILVLTYSSLTLLKERRATHIEAKSCLGALSAERLARNAQELDHFRTFTKPDSTTHARSAQEKGEKEAEALEPKALQERTPKELKEYESRRKDRRSCSLSKFNLNSLLNSPPELLEPKARALFTSLYADAPYFREAVKTAPRLFDELFTFILKNIKEKGEEFAFTALLQENPPHAEALYKILKGTNAYDLETGKGFPPLEDLFTYDPKEAKAFSLHFASKAILTTVYGSKITQAIQDKEKEKWKQRKRRPYLTKAEFEELLVEESALAALTPNVAFLMRAMPSTHAFSDPETHIQVKKTLNSWKPAEGE